MDREPESFAQFFGEYLHLVGLSPFGATHAQGQTDHNLSDVILLNHTLQLFKVVSLIPALQGFESLRGNPKRVRYRDSDPPRTYIETKNPTNSKRVRLGIFSAGWCRIV
jgi:hypothetical protein